MAITQHQQAPADWNAVVAANLRAQLALLGWSQAQLATALGTNEMWISRRLKGGTKFDADEIVMFADFFDVPVADLFNTKKTPAPKGEGRVLPDLDSNQEPADSQPEQEHDATITPLHPRVAPGTEHDHLAPVIVLGA